MQTLCLVKFPKGIDLPDYGSSEDLDAEDNEGWWDRRTDLVWLGIYRNGKWNDRGLDFGWPIDLLQTLSILLPYQGYRVVNDQYTLRLKEMLPAMRKYDAARDIHSHTLGVPHEIGLVLRAMRTGVASPLETLLESIQVALQGLAPEERIVLCVC